MNEWTHTQTHTHTMEYYSAIKNEWNLDISDNIDGPQGNYSKWNKWGKDKYCMISLI